MAKVQVASGICGLNATIAARGDDQYDVVIAVTSECPRVRKLADEVTHLSALTELMLPINETMVYRSAARAKCHAACPVPSAILKAIEVAAGMALPADVHMGIERE